MDTKSLWRNLLGLMKEVRVAAILFVVLFSINAFLNPGLLSPRSIGGTLGMISPLILSAAAVMVVFLTGRGGVDLSVGPLMALIDVIIVKKVIVEGGIGSPFAIIPIALGIGLVSGLLNGTLVNIVRIQPVVATLATYLIYSGLAIWIMPSPGGTVPEWLARISTSLSPLPVLLVAVLWFLFTKTLFYSQLMATGSDDRAAYTSGVDVVLVRMGAYVLTGIFAAVGALSLCSLIGSADARVGSNYTMTAIASATLGGVSLAGGKGTLWGAVIGALDIFLLQSILTYFNMSAFVLQIAYGVILLFALTVGSGKKPFGIIAGLLRRG